MKKILYILAALVLLASCQKDAGDDAAFTVTYTLVPEVSFSVKSEAQTSPLITSVNTLSCLVYHFKNGNYEYVPEMSSFLEISDPANIRVPIKLFKEQEYRLVFVAQHCIKSQQRTVDYVYNINNGIMRVNNNAVITSGDQLEAFAYVDEVGPKTSSESKTITLNRIVSQVNIGTSATKESLPSSLKVEVSGIPESYDIVNDRCSEETRTLTLDNISVLGDKMTVSETDYNRLATLYFLGSNKIDITLTKNANDQDTFTIEQVNTKVNYKTNIVGNI